MKTDCSLTSQILIGIADMINADEIVSRQPRDLRRIYAILWPLFLCSRVAVIVVLILALWIIAPCEWYWRKMRELWNG